MKRPLETVPVYAFYADPADEFASVDGFDWFWSKDSAYAAFDDACTSSHYGTDALQVLEVLVPVSVTRQGWGATTEFISDQADRGPGRGRRLTRGSTRPGHTSPRPGPKSGTQYMSTPATAWRCSTG